MYVLITMSCDQARDQYHMIQSLLWLMTDVCNWLVYGCVEVVDVWRWLMWCTYVCVEVADVVYVRMCGGG